MHLTSASIHTTISMCYDTGMWLEWSGSGVLLSRASSPNIVIGISAIIKCTAETISRCCERNSTTCSADIPVG